MVRQTPPIRQGVLISLPCIRQIKMVKIFKLISEFMTNLKIKTKNDYFMDMLSEITQSIAKIQFITGDSWYSSTENLKP